MKGKTHQLALKTNKVVHIEYSRKPCEMGQSDQEARTLSTSLCGEAFLRFGAGRVVCVGRVG